MLKRRVILSLTFLDGVLYRTKKFKPDLRYTSNFVDGGADEIFAIDVGTDRPAFWKAVEKIADQCFCPLAVGGYIKSVADVREALLRGADKVVVNSAAIDKRSILSDIAEKFGSQCAVAGVDVKNGMAWKSHGTIETAYDAAGWARKAVVSGAGEIFLQNIDLDGSLNGYDIAALRAVLKVVSVPVVIGSGCGSWAHMDEAFKAGASGCATSNIYHFTAESLGKARTYLSGKGVDVRP